MTGLDHTLVIVALGAAILGLVAGVLGAFAVLRRQSLMGDALSHAALPGLCLGFLVAGGRAPSALMAGALLSGGVAALVVLAVARNTRLKPDAALGIVLSVFFAGGLVLLGVVQGRDGAAGLQSFLFGQAAAMLRDDVILMSAVALGVLGALALAWNGVKLVAYDAAYARVLGLPVRALDLGLTLLIAVAVVLGLQLVGVVLMTALLIAPAVAARQWARRLESMVLLSGLFGALSGVAGALVSSSARGVATGPVIVLIATAIAVLSLLIAPGRGVLARALAANRARGRMQDGQVLDVLQGLAEAHDNPSYPAETGMIGSALPARPGAALMARLEAQGLVRAVSHPPDPSPRWELTEAGHKRARDG
jgi:manganese/zinc/iron transport system permease protein